MALFPGGNDIITFSSKDAAVREMIENAYNNALMVNQSYWDEATIDARFNAGDQRLWSEYYNIPVRTRKNYNFNHIRRVTSVLSGYQRRTRRSMIVTPEDNNGQQTADQFTKLLSTITRNCNALDVLSDAFNGAIVTGMNVLHIWVDYRNDPISGEIKVDNCSYNTFIIDPYFRKRDLSDCNFMWKRSFLTKDAAMSLMPHKRKEIKRMSSYYSDSKFPYMPESDLSNKELLAYDEYYYRSYRKQKLLADVNLGETLEWTGSDENLREFLDQYPQIQVIETTVPTVKLALLINGSVMYHDINPLGIDTYPFVPVFGYFDEDVHHYPLKIQGIVRGLRDVQFLYNRRRIIELDHAESLAGNGYIYKEDSLVDPDDPLKTGNGRMIRLKKDASMTDFAPLPVNEIPQSWPQLTEALSREFQEIPGINEELLGVADDFKSAALARQRHGWALIQQQTLFDQLDYSQKLLGETMIKVIQNNYTPGKIKRMIGEEPTQEFYSKKFAKYNVSVEEGFDTSTQKQQEFTQLVVLKELGIDIPESAMIQAATIQNKDDIIQAINEQKQQAQQAEQAQAQMSAKEQEATMNMMNARAESDLAMAKRRQSEIDTDRFNMLNGVLEAARDEQKADLDAVKALKDLEASDPNKIDELVELMKIIQSQRNQADGPVFQEEELLSQNMANQPIGQEEYPDEQAFKEEMMQPEEQIFNEMI